MKYILAILISACPGARAWTLNDVSILLPLPKADQRSLLLGPASSGGRGELLPTDVYRKLPRLVAGTDREAMYSDLKVVAIRIDPCFRERGGPTACRRQIRMVWQPVLLNGLLTITADAAIHTFYDLSEPEWSALLAELTPLAGADETESLDVHPRIRAQGLTGPHWSALKGILIKYAGRANLSRATSMSVDTLGSFWFFTGVDVRAGGITRIPIPRAHNFTQAIFADITRLSDLHLRVNPEPDASASWLTTIADSVGAADRIGERGIREVLREAVRLENPSLEDTGSVDCVSCHIAQNVRMWGERRHLNWKWQFEDEAYRNKSLADLRNNSVRPGFTNRLRAFGYFVDEPVIAQRLINESADVLVSIRGQ